MNGTEGKRCSCGRNPCAVNSGNSIEAFSRLQQVVCRLVKAGEGWIQAWGCRKRTEGSWVHFDEGLHWEAKAALECVNRSCSGECAERPGAEENLAKSLSQQKADECEVLLEKAGKRLSQAHDVMEAAERVVEVARRSVEKAEEAHQAAKDVMGVSQRDRYWGKWWHHCWKAREATKAARVGRARVLVALAATIGMVSGELAPQG